MLNKVCEAIEEVLNSIDVGGEQTRQFAEEIKILRGVIGYPDPGTDDLNALQRRRQMAQKLRRLAIEAEGLTADLPNLPIKDWLNRAKIDLTKGVFFGKYDLACLLQFIADIGITRED